MRIVHIIDCLNGGGIQNFLLSLLPEQVKQGHMVELIVIERYGYDYCYHLESIFSVGGVRVHRLNKKRHNKLSLIRTILKCRKLISGISPDILNTHGVMSHIYGALSTLCKRIGHVITVHNAPENWSKACKFLCSSKPLIFCSQSAFDMRLQNSRKMQVIENGISPDAVRCESKVDLKEELSLMPTDRVIVLVGSLRPQKNYEFIKKLVDQAGDSSLHFCICGGNYGKGYVPSSAFKGYEQNIHLLGLRSDVSAIENGADLFLSCASFEGLPIAVLEAYFNGIPCVLSPIPQHKAISDVYKVYIPSDFEPISFVAKINEALLEHESHLEIYDKRKGQIVRFTVSDTSKKYIEFYREILNGE